MVELELRLVLAFVLSLFPVTYADSAINQAQQADMAALLIKLTIRVEPTANTH